MTTTSIFKNSCRFLAGVFLVSTLAHAESLSMANAARFNSDDSKQQFKSEVLPEPVCNTDVAANLLRQEVRSNPLPTFDGVSPWPGLYGFWVHQQAGVYVLVSGKSTTTTLLSRGASQRALKVQIKIVNLCTHEIIATGTTTLTSADYPRNQIKIKLRNSSLNNAIAPTATLARVANPKSQTVIKDAIGLTLRFRPAGKERGDFRTESILLKNVLNL